VRDVTVRGLIAGVARARPEERAPRMAEERILETGLWIMEFGLEGGFE
jgi:hypothetical protein